MGAGSAAASPESFLFNLLSMLSSGEAAPKDLLEGLQGFADKTVDSGETSPSDGNLLPLLAFLLNALPPQAGQVSAQASIVAEGRTGGSSTAISGQANAQDLLKQLALALQPRQGELSGRSAAQGDAVEGNALLAMGASQDGSTPLPVELLRQLTQVQSEQSAGPETNELPQALKEAIARLVPSGSAADKNAADVAKIPAAGAQSALQTGAALAPEPGSTTASRFFQGLDGETGAVLRQLLSSQTGAALQGESVAVAPGAENGVSLDRNSQSSSGANAFVGSIPPDQETNNPLSIESLTARLEAVRAGLNSAPATVGETQRWLREIGWDRRASVDMTQPSSVIPSHGLLAKPADMGDAAPANTPPMLQLNTPMNSPQWADGLGDHIVWLSDQSLSNAQIRLNPPHLGPIEVSVSVTDDQTQVSFVAHHAATREALEAAAPRLRETLSAHGLGTVNVNIDHQAAGGRSSQQPQGYEAWQAFSGGSADPLFNGSASSRELPVGASRSIVNSSAHSLIDTYA